MLANDGLSGWLRELFGMAVDVEDGGCVVRDR